jgi:hypothetical protein
MAAIIHMVYYIGGRRIECKTYTLPGIHLDKTLHRLHVGEGIGMVEGIP